MDELAGQSLGGYLLEEEIGRGSMGMVYRGKQIALGREVAIKVLPQALARDASYVARFIREAQITAGLNHPNIVQIYDAGQQNKLLYFVMEYVQGPTLASLLHLDGIIPQHLAVEYAAQIADALDCAYSERNVIHRDIKPENLMLDRWGKIKVMDFGLARATGHQRITVARTLVGSIYYASPEQVWGQTLDNRSDIYALGVVLYEMVSGHRPFTGRSMPELTQNIISGQIQPPGIYNPELLPALEQIILAAIARDRNYRYANARLLAEQLRALHLQAPTVFSAIQRENTTASPLRERIVIHPPKRPQHKRPPFYDASTNETTSEAHKSQNQDAFSQEAAIDSPTPYVMPEYPLSTTNNRQSVEEAQPPTQALVLLPTQTHPQKQPRRSFWAILARWLRPTSRP